LDTTYWQIVQGFNNRQYKTGIEHKRGIFLPDAVYGQALDSLVAACVDIILVFNNQIMIAKRNWQPQPDWWIIGGRMRKGELYEEAALRNIHRELSLVIQPERLELFNFYSFIWDKRAQEPVGNGSHTLSVVMLLRLTESEVAALTLNEEYEDAIWLTLEAVIGCPKTYHPALIQMARDLQAKLNS